MTLSTLSIALLFPELLGTYGDGGNVVVLQRRLEWRGLLSKVVAVGLRDPVPADCDLYLLGGGEDQAQTHALAALHAGSGLQRAVARGAPVFAVCAGLQLLGHAMTDRGGTTVAGLGLLDADTRLLPGRLVGEVVATPAAVLGLPPLTGFANHAGATRLGQDARPLATIVTGPGNDAEPAASDPAQRVPDTHGEGALQGSIVATYLHGPVLARNPALADLLLARAAGRTLEPLHHEQDEAVRRERLARTGRLGRRR